MEKTKPPLYLRMGVQIFFMIIMLLLFAGRTYLALRDVGIEESNPISLSNLPDQKKQFGQGIPMVETGLYVRDFPTFDMETGNFEMEGDLWFLFNPNLISLNTIGKFEFERGEIVKKSNPITKMLDGKIFAVYPIKVKFTSELNHIHFPFNDHRIFLILKMGEILPSEVQLEVPVDGLKMGPAVSAGGWKAEKVQAEAGYVVDSLSVEDNRKTISYPRVVFSIDFRKPGTRLALVILMPIIILFAFGLMALLVDEMHDIRLNICAATLTGLVVSGFIIESMSPHVNYFTISDYMYLISLFSTFLVLFVVIRDMQGKSKMYSRQFNTKMFFVLPIAFFLIYCFIL